MTELWKDIEGFEGRYMVSNTGKILSLNFKNTHMARTLKPTKSDNGYLAVVFYEKDRARRFYVHRLVAEAFMENPRKLPEINHIDGNKENNHISNLEWCSSSYNKRHGVRLGLYNGMVKTVISQMKPMIATNLQTGERQVFYSLSDAQQAVGGHKANISKVLHGEKKSCKGYAFAYIDKGGDDDCEGLILSLLRQRKQRRGLFSISPLLQEQVF